jgi:RNA exonuclease 4
MVGTGPGGLDSAVARVTICNWDEEVVMDTYVKVPTKITDYRTFVSGIEAKDLEGPHVMSLEQARTAVKSILQGKILIGHALENDLAALKITHPWHDIRDTANYPPYMKEIRDGEDKLIMAPRKLKDLAWDHLGRDIQTQGQAHNPIEDARAALRLYKSERMEWELMVMAQVKAASAKEEEGREVKSSPRGQACPVRFDQSPRGQAPHTRFDQSPKRNTPKRQPNSPQKNSNYRHPGYTPTRVMNYGHTPPRGYVQYHPAYYAHYSSPVMSFH